MVNILSTPCPPPPHTNSSSAAGTIKRICFFLSLAFRELRTYIWDVEDLSAPVLMNTYYHFDSDGNPLRSIDHNQYVVGDITYQADYETGLRMYRIDQAAYTLDLVGFFDVFPSRNTDNFEGAWSVYPYFASGEYC